VEQKYSALELKCIQLAAENQKLISDFEAIKLENTKNLPIDDAIKNPSLMSDDLKIYLINAFLLLLCVIICFGFLHFSYNVILSKMAAVSNNLIIKPSFGLLSGFSHYVGDFSASEIMTSSLIFSYQDPLNNLIKVVVSSDRKTADVFIKTSLSEGYQTLSSFFETHPELFDQYAMLASDSLEPNITEGLAYFNSFF